MRNWPCNYRLYYRRFSVVSTHTDVWGLAAEKTRPTPPPPPPAARNNIIFRSTTAASHHHWGNLLKILLWGKYFIFIVQGKSPPFSPELPLCDIPQLGPPPASNGRCGVGEGGVAGQSSLIFLSTCRYGCKARPQLDVSHCETLQRSDRTTRTTRTTRTSNGPTLQLSKSGQSVSQSVS